MKTGLYVVFYAILMSATIFFAFKDTSWIRSSLLFFFAGFLARHVVKFVQSTTKKGP